MVSSSRSSSAGSSKGSVKSYKSGSSTTTVESDDFSLPRNKAVETLIYLSGGRPSRHRNLRKCRIITEYDDAGSFAGSSRGSSASFRRKEVVQWFFVGDRYEPWLVEVDDDDDRRSNHSRGSKKGRKSRGGSGDNRPPPVAPRDPVWGRPGPQNGPQQHHPPPPHNQHHMHMEEEIIDDDSETSSYVSDDDYGWQQQPPPPPMGPPLGMGFPPMNRAPPMNPHMGGPVPPMPGPSRTPVPETGDGGEPLFFKLN